MAKHIINKHFLVVLVLVLVLNHNMCWGRDILTSGAGDGLNTNQGLDSGPYHFICQNDCNMVLYDNAGTKKGWQSNTSGRGKNCKCYLDNTGNFYALSESGKVVWSTGSSGATGEYVMVLLPSAKLVIYGSSAQWTNRAMSVDMTGGATTNSAAADRPNFPKRGRVIVQPAAGDV